MGTRVFLGNKMLQDKIDTLEDMLHEERQLTTRNALQAMRFQEVLERIRDYPHGDMDSAPIFRDWARKVLEG